MEDNQHFEELVTQAEAAKQLGVSVTTLKRYSLIIEDVTNSQRYYARTKRNSRLYSQKNIEELKNLKAVARGNKLTLQEAAERIFLISDKDKTVSTQTGNLIPNSTLVDAKQVVNLLNMLQQTIVTQNKAIQDLQAQVARVEKQNQELIDGAHRLPDMKSKDNDNSNSASHYESNLSRTTMNEDSNPIKNETKEKKVDQEVEDVREEILRKARENQQKRAQQNVHRTLAEMQIQQKKHWWQKIFR